MKLTSLCYIEKDGAYLMLLRVKKAQDENAGRWIGVGGKFEENETPAECMLREVREETGLVPRAWAYRGIVTFLSDIYETEYMHLFTVTAFEGELTEKDYDRCREGVLRWVPKNEVPELNTWEGDRIFLRLLDERHDFFSLKLRYEGDTLAEAVLEN